MARRPSSVCPSVRRSVNVLRKSLLVYGTNDSIATKLAQDGLQMSLLPGCAQGQGHGHVTYNDCTEIASSSTLMAAS